MYTPQITDANKKYGNNRWLAYSPKLGRTVYLFSDIEYEHWLQVEFNSKVVNFCEQPLKIEINNNGNYAASIFDMWVQYEDGSEEFIEIKYTSDLSKERVAKQISVQKTWCNENNKQHKVMTEVEIKQSPMRLSNLKLMIKFLEPKFNQPEQIKVIKQILSGNKLTVESLSTTAKIPYEEIRIIVNYLIYKNEIKSNYFEKPFGKKMEVWI